MVLLVKLFFIDGELHLYILKLVYVCLTASDIGDVADCYHNVSLVFSVEGEDKKFTCYLSYFLVYMSVWLILQDLHKNIVSSA